MKKNILRSICFLAALSILLLTLISCNGETGVTSDPGSDANSETDSSVVEFTEPVYNLGGKEILIYTHDYEGPTETDPMYQSVIDTETKYNCKVVWTPVDIGTTHQDILASTVSGTYICDAFWVEWYNVYPKFSGSGSIINLAEYYDFQNDPDWKDDYGNFGTWFDGKKWGVNVPGAGTGYAIWYNADLLEKAGLPDLWEYVENDTWNWDTFLNVCKELNKLEEVEYAYIDENPFGTFVVANGGKYLETSSSPPKFILGDKPADIDALQFVYDMVNVEKVMPPMHWITENGGYFAVMQMGKAAMFPYGLGFGPWLVSNGGVDPEDMGWIYIPKGPDADDYYINNLTSGPMYAVPSTVSDKKEIVAVLQNMFKYWSDQKTNPIPLSLQYQQAIESSDYDGILSGDSPRAENNKKLFLEGYKNTVYLYDLNYGIYQYLREVYYWPMERGELQVVSGLDSVKQSVQDLIDSFFPG